jgi:hypothetical protein
VPYPGFTPRPAESMHRTKAHPHARPGVPWKRKTVQQNRKRRKPNPFENVRKKKSPRKMETFSSDSGGAGWSNH